jgi:hypothetical protein
MIRIHFVAAVCSGLMPQIVKSRAPRSLAFRAPGMEANLLSHLHLTPLTPPTPLSPLHLQLISTFRRTI